MTEQFTVPIDVKPEGTAPATTWNVTARVVNRQNDTIAVTSNTLWTDVEDSQVTPEVRDTIKAIVDRAHAEIVEVVGRLMNPATVPK